jgi:CBS domain-containing protein
MRIEEVMCRDVQHCSPEDSLESAARLMWEHDCGCAPVCTGDGEQRVVGMITDRDISMCALFQGKPLSQLKVRDAMSRDVGSCRPADDTSRVERLMSDRQVRRVPVVNEEGNLVGIVSLADLVRHAKPRNSRAPGRVTESEIRETLANICAPSRSEEAPSAMAGPAPGQASGPGLSPSH